jgi:hypothetical protein
MILYIIMYIMCVYIYIYCGKANHSNHPQFRFIIGYTTLYKNHRTNWDWVPLTSGL